jgi:hypothetical protein
MRPVPVPLAAPLRFAAVIRHPLDQEDDSDADDGGPKKGEVGGGLSLPAAHLSLRGSRGSHEAVNARGNDGRGGHNGHGGAVAEVTVAHS